MQGRITEHRQNKHDYACAVSGLMKDEWGTSVLVQLVVPQ